MILLRTLIFTLVVPGTVTVLVPRWLLSSSSAPLLAGIGGFRYLGMLPILVGAAIYFWCAWNFTFAGRGTPAPIDPPKKLVVQGLYRYVRNPMYLGVLCILLGEAWLFQSGAILKYAAGGLICAHLFVLLYEEPVLRGKFGEAYQRYCEAVPRWIPARRSRQTKSASA